MSPDSKRLWGRMSVHEMLCHVSDGYRAALGEKYIAPKSGLLERTLIKWLVLNMPRWPKNVPTRPEVEQGKGGTPPTEFEHDRSDLLQLIDRFCDTEDSALGSHPILGPMHREEWMRWGYRHADHHLSQFGA